MAADPTDGHWVVVNGASLAWYDHTGRRWTLDPDYLMDVWWTAATPDITYAAFAALIDALRAARVVADRPDQPTPGTVLFEGTVWDLWHLLATDITGGPFGPWQDTRVTVHAADPHTGHDHE